VTKNANHYRAKCASSSLKQLSFDLIVTDPEAYRAQGGQKQRKCLSCSKSFNSAGFGNRLCTRCKGTETFTCSPSSFTVHASF
jgi:hypothetical protein